MPLRKEPDTLFNLSVKKLAFWFIKNWNCGKECIPIKMQSDILKRSSTEITQFTRKVVSLKLDIPKLFDDLPVYIFNEIVPKVASAYVCSRTVNRHCLTCLRKLLAVIMTKRLKRWDMMEFFSWLDSFTKSNIAIKVILLQIPFMKNIVHLSLGFFCDDSILRCIGENCHLIEHLDIQNSDFTDEGLMYLIPSENSAGCPKLKELLLLKWEIDITSHTVALLLKSLPDIVYIRCDNMRSAIEELLNINESQNSLVLQLKRLDFILEMSPLNSIDIIRLSKLCPNLEELKIRFKEDKDVLALKHFPCLSRLHLNYYIWNSAVPVAEVKYFKECCKQITSLTITCDILDTTCISLLSKHCPSLTDLGIEFNDVVVSEPFNRDEENNLKILSTFNLKVDDVHDRMTYDSRYVIRDLLCSLLKSTDTLTKVTLNLPARCWSHQELQFLLDVVDVHLLHTLTIVTSKYHFKLLMKSVYLILEKCPLLKSLGNLGSWSYVDVKKLRREMKYLNYDIEIIKGIKT